MRVRPELIAPAGTLECARAAVANGADAVYFGLPRFNARIRAENIAAAQVPELVRFLHEHGVRAYAALNTLIFTGELADAERNLLLLDEAGVDAVLLQDLGAARLAAALGLRLERHASTQMTITSPAGARFAARLGLRRVVVARELSLRDLAAFGEVEGIALEVFVHGALCVAYSGQCLTSEALGQRSANRGECAQACRLPYELVVDGVVRSLGDRRYLLSPQDLAALREIPELLRLGVGGFKIEGRLKSPEYVAAVTQVYRRAIDAALAGAAPVAAPGAEEWYQLEMAFSRGLCPGWLHGVNHQQLVGARFGKKRGALVGTVRRVAAGHVEVALRVPVRPGDGVVFDTGGDTDREQGGRVHAVHGERLSFAPGHLDPSRLRAGDRVWKTSDPQLERRLRRTYRGALAPPRQPLDLEVAGAAGEPLRVAAAAGGCRVEAASAIPLEPAARHPLTTAVLREQLGRLGATPFALGRLENRLAGELMLPLSELNRVRRTLAERAVAALEARRGPGGPERPRPPPALGAMLERIRAARAAGGPPPAECVLAVLCRSMEQLEAALDAGCRVLYVDFEDLRRCRDAVALGRGRPGATVILATPRIEKPGESGFTSLIDGLAPDGVLIRNLGGLARFRDRPYARVGDFSLNVANPLAAELLIGEGLDRVTLAYDLDARQVAELARAAPPSWFELVLHQHMPLFHMDHCIFAAFLSGGTDHTDCGRPCDRHSVRLRDRVGAEHLVKADAGCRNTVYHARAQSGAEHLSDFLAAGLRAFRVELLDEDAARTREIVTAYRELLARGGRGGSELLRRLGAAGQLGVTSGTLTVLG